MKEVVCAVHFQNQDRGREVRVGLFSSVLIRRKLEPRPGPDCHRIEVRGRGRDGRTGSLQSPQIKGKFDLRPRARNPLFVIKGPWPGIEPGLAGPQPTVLTATPPQPS